MPTCVFYIDEAGDSRKHEVPLREGDTPIFTLAAVAFPLHEWKDRDRIFLRLKRQFFPERMNKEDKRDEHIEIKGNYLAAPRNSQSKRNHAFLKTILKLIGKRNGVCFGVSFIKDHINPISHISLYTHALQVLVERFNLFITENPFYNNAIMVCDSRSKGLKGEDNLIVIKSHMSYIFGHKIGKTFTNIMEGPLFADSKLCAGLQLVDIFASSLYTNHYNYYLGKDSPTPLVSGHDYSHMTQYWPTISYLEFKSKEEFYGYRVIDHRHRLNL